MEMLIYVAISALLTVATVTVIVELSSSYRTLVVNRHILGSAGITMERLTREIRAATSVDTVASVFNQHPGALELLTLDSSGGTRRVRFSTANGRILISENGAAALPISSGNASTTNLVFRHITTPKSQAVRIELTIAATSSAVTKQATFYDSIVLRGSY